MSDTAGTAPHPGKTALPLDGLRRQLRGVLTQPDDLRYDTVRRVWNGMVDRRPAAIAECVDAHDVATAIAFARGHGLALALRGGGHSISGQSVCDGGLMIDLSPMKAIAVDPARRVARAGSGVLLGELDAATQVHGLATTLGVNSDTGIAGLTLGGGIGRLAHKHGLACDNLLAAEIVLADGRIVKASATEHPDLFWALRGGGGNFGAVTAFEYRLHPLGPTILGGMLLYAWPDAREAMRNHARFLRTAPEEVDLLGVLLTSPAGDPVFAISVIHAGPIAQAESALRPLREATPKPLDDSVAPMAYTALQASADGIFPRGRRYYWKTHFLPAISDAIIDTTIAHFAQVPSAMSVIGFQQLGGAMARVPADATAFANRGAAFDFLPIAIWEDAAQDARNIAWARGLWEATRAFATGGVYVNNLGEEGEERLRAAYGANHARLAAVKARYDPGNLFRLNQNIRPAG